MDAREEREQKEARKFLRKKYGIRNIVSMSPPVGTSDFWYARISEKGISFGVEFRKRGTKWQCRELRS